jgi:hypothetical protein
VLFAAARRMSDPLLERESLVIARAAAQRPIDRRSILDGGLCHGAAALMQIYSRLWQATGEELFAEAARRWFEELLIMRQPGLGVAGFRTAVPRGEQIGWRDDDTSFLTGAAGIALALLAATSDLEPAWDRALLLSLIPTEE